MVECEKRGIPYLFKLRQIPKVKNLIHLLEQEGGWVDCGQGFEGIEGEVRLGGWSCKCGVIVARRLALPHDFGVIRLVFLAFELKFHTVKVYGLEIEQSQR